MALPVFDVGRIFEWTASATKTVILWGAAKILIATILITFVPIAVYKGICLVMEYVYQAANSVAGTDGIWSGQIIEYTGLGAWLATQLKLPECASLYLGALAVVFALSFLRR